MADHSPGHLSIVASPIGNLGDLSLRAIEVLRDADLIACEDTRHSSVLLRHHGISTRTVSLHEHNEAKRSQELVAKMLEGASVALISDAGLPAVSDPGQRLLQSCIASGIPHDVIPGPCAVVTALVGSGLPTHPFFFGGFLPVKKGKRAREIASALGREFTSVYFESPHRLIATLQTVAELDGARPITVAREMTKKFQEFRRGSGIEVAHPYLAQPPTGEITLVISGTDLPRWMRWPETPTAAPGATDASLDTSDSDA